MTRTLRVINAEKLNFFKVLTWRQCSELQKAHKDIHCRTTYRNRLVIFGNTLRKFTYFEHLIRAHGMKTISCKGNQKVFVEKDKQLPGG